MDSGINQKVPVRLNRISNDVINVNRPADRTSGKSSSTLKPYPESQKMGVTLEHIGPMVFFVTKKLKNHIKLFNRILKAFDEDILDFYDGNYDFEII